MCKQVKAEFITELEISQHKRHLAAEELLLKLGLVEVASGTLVWGSWRIQLSTNDKGNQDLFPLLS